MNALRRLNKDEFLKIVTELVIDEETVENQKKIIKISKESKLIAPWCAYIF